MNSHLLMIDAHEQLVNMANEIRSIQIPLRDSKTIISRPTEDHRQQSNLEEQNQEGCTHFDQDTPMECGNTGQSDLDLYSGRVLDCFAKSYAQMEQVRQKILKALNLTALRQPERQVFNMGINPIPGMMYHISRDTGLKDEWAIMLCPSSTGKSLAEKNAQALKSLENCCRYIPDTNTSFCLQDLRHSFPVIRCFDEEEKVAWVSVERLRETDLARSISKKYEGVVP